jgi:hypothetical protein
VLIPLAPLATSWTRPVAAHLRYLISSFSALGRRGELLKKWACTLDTLDRIGDERCAAAGPKRGDMAVYPEAPHPHPWGFWATTGWAMLSFTAAMLVAMGCAAVWRSLHPDQSLTAALSGPLLLVCTTAAAPAQILGRPPEAVARRRISRISIRAGPMASAWRNLPCDCAANARFTDAPHRSADCITLSDAILCLSPRGRFLPLLWVTFALIAPAVEEITFRGFLYRGWSASRLGIFGAILLTSALWSLLHIQYDWIIIGQIFCIGLMFGCFRWLSGSTSLTIILHALMNFWGLLETIVTIEGLS